MNHATTTTRRELPAVAIGGMLMGAADIVPGVSGGTVALLLGIYEHLVANIRRGSGAIAAAIRGDLRGAFERARTVEWPWLIALVSGVLLSVALLTSTIEHQLEVNPIPMSGLFLGLVAGSTVIAAGDLERWTRTEVVAAVVTAIMTFLLLGLRPVVVDAPGPLLFFGAGAIAICAMILPGISGSFLLLTMGMYEPLLDAISDRDLVVVLVFVSGTVVGLASFSTVLSWALQRWHDLLLAVLVGLMIGSIRVLWPWPSMDGVGDTRIWAPDGQVLEAAVAAAVGFVVVLLVARIARRRLD